MQSHESCVWLHPELSESLGLGIFIHLLWNRKTHVLQGCSGWQVWWCRTKKCIVLPLQTGDSIPYSLTPSLQPLVSHSWVTVEGDHREAGVDLSCPAEELERWSGSASWYDDLLCLGGAGRALTSLQVPEHLWNWLDLHGELIQFQSLDQW